MNAVLSIDAQNARITNRIPANQRGLVMETAKVAVEVSAGTITLGCRDGEETISFDEL